MICGWLFVETPFTSSPQTSLIQRQNWPAVSFFSLICFYKAGKQALPVQSSQREPPPGPGGGLFYSKRFINSLEVSHQYRNRVVFRLARMPNSTFRQMRTIMEN